MNYYLQEYLEILADIPRKLDSQGDSEDLDFSHRHFSEGDDQVFVDDVSDNNDEETSLSGVEIEESSV